MATITYNDIYILNETISGVSAVSFNYLGEKMYALQEIEKIVGVFVSAPIVGDSTLVSWKDMTVDMDVLHADTDVYMYIRAAQDEDSLEGTSWYGPFFNDVSDISDITDPVVQIMVVLLNKNATGANNTPVINSIELSFYSSDSAVKFYTKAFDLGFAPKHVVLTYNGNIPDDAIVQFSVSGFDSVDPNDYQVVEANKVVKLDELSILSDKIKVMLSIFGAGSSGVLVAVDEFALLVGGDGQTYLNLDSSSSSS